MKRTLLISLILISVVSFAQAATEQYSGVYSGDYDGPDDNGTWTIQFDQYGNGAISALSYETGEMDSGFGDLFPTGSFTLYLDSGVLVIGSIDEFGNIEGIWDIPDTDYAGTMKGGEYIIVTEKIPPLKLDNSGSSGGGGGCFISTITLKTEE